MEKLNNILNREEYIKSMNEGRIGDFLKKGVQKIKSAFGILVRKIKGIITVFDTNGNVLPVVTPAAVADHFNGNRNIKVYGSNELSNDIREMGGKGCITGPVEIRENEETNDEAPDGAEDFVKWKKTGYKQSNFYKNLQTMKEMVNESFLLIDGNAEEINEEKLNPNDSIRYSGKKVESVENFTVITTDKFKKLLQERIDFYCDPTKKEANEGKTAPGNIFIFGAPGIGKSTIPKSIVEEYNKEKSKKDRIALIGVNCGQIKAGDFIMPSFPRNKDVMAYLEANKEYLQGMENFDKMDDEKKKKLQDLLSKSSQKEAQNAPQPWLPCYRVTGTTIDRYLDIAANGGKMATGKKVPMKDEFSGEMVDVEETYETGSGGIVFFDEFLRADPNVFKEFMTFLLDRQMYDWRLGSKWFVIACSNRPCDDDETEEGWATQGGAGRDRWCHIFHMDPDPEDWKDWARKKGFDETLLKFIFEKTDDNRVDGEYYRWYRVVSKDSLGGDSHKPVTPRDWERAHDELVNFSIDHKERFKDGFSICKMSINEVKECLGGIFDDSFIEEIVQWLRDNCNGLDLEKIITNPTETPMPMGKTINEVTVMNSLFEKMKEKYSKTGKSSDLTEIDNELANIAVWIGINYKNNFNIVMENFLQQFKYIFNSKYNIPQFPKFWLTMMAAFPEDDNMEGIKLLVNGNDEIKPTESVYTTDEKTALKTTKTFAKEFFPWRIKGDKLISVFDLEGNTDNGTATAETEVEPETEE